VPDRAEIARRAADLCHRLPAGVVESICMKLERAVAANDRDSLLASLAGIAETSARIETTDLLTAWLATDPGASPRDFAYLLRGASAADQKGRQRQQVELVWTGPSPHHSKFRRTDQALLEVIQTARRDLWIVSYASYKVPNIAAAIADAARRGVRIRLVLESKEDSSGALTFSALTGLGAELGEKATVYVWPKDQRPSEGSNRGVLHAKCAVADRDALFVSSANLTGNAMLLNMEMGILVRGSVIPRRAAEHLEWLVEHGTLRKPS
jgi:phosphatidylserine/phosphatidylglycerophosphate/cardiolipin synthase-like enzyme